MNDEKLKLISELLCNRDGDDNILMTGLIMWLLSTEWNKDQLKIILEIDVTNVCGWCWIDYHKDYHNSIRKNGTTPLNIVRGADKYPLMYIQQLFGRLSKELNWKTELAECEQAEKKKMMWVSGRWVSAKNNIKQVFKDIFGSMSKLSESENPQSFWSTRHEWLASGSAGDKGKTFTRDEIEDIVGDRPESQDIKSNKRSWCESMTFNDYRKLFSRDGKQRVVAKIEAIGHTKPEVGAVRGIYGVSTDHYLRESWTANLIESHLKESRADLGLEDYGDGFKMLELQKKSADPDVCFNSFDFSHMDKQHSEATLVDFFTEMKIGLLRKGCETSFCDELITQCDWLVEACQNQYLTTSEGRKKVDGTLFTGARFTMLINTLANIAYHDSVKQTLSNIYGIDVSGKSVHRGDDIVWECDYTSGLLFNSFAPKCLVECKEAKLMLGSECEYLRNSYRKGKVQGSVTRSIGSFISGNWESDSEPNVLDKITSLHANLEVLIRRGFKRDLAQSIFDSQKSYFGKDPVDPDGGTISSMLTRTSRGSGGLGLINWNDNSLYTQLGVDGETNSKIQAPNIRKLFSLDNNMFKDLGKKNYSTNDYTNWVKSKLSDWGTLPDKNAKGLRGMFMQSTLGLEFKSFVSQGKRQSRSIREANSEIKRIVPFVEKERFCLEKGAIRNSYKLENVKGNARIRGLAFSKKSFSKWKTISIYFEPNPGLDRTKDLLAQIVSGGDFSFKKISNMVETSLDNLAGSRIAPEVLSIISNWYWLNHDTYDIKEWHKWLCNIVASNEEVLANICT